MSSRSSNKRLQCHDWWHRFFNQPINNNIKANENREIAYSQGDDYTIGCLLDYPYLKKKMIAIDLSKQGARDADPRAIRQIYFTGNLDRTECA